MAAGDATEIAFVLRFRAVVRDRVAEMASAPEIREEARQKAAELRVQADLVEQGVPIDRVMRD